MNGIPEGIFGGGTKDKLLVYHFTFAIDRICVLRFAASWLTTPVSSHPVPSTLSLAAVVFPLTKSACGVKKMDGTRPLRILD